MNYAAVLRQLNDLPSTYLRAGNPFGQVQESQASAAARLTNASDALLAQTEIDTASDGWLDVWGLLFNISRLSDESDYNYRIRILATIMAWVGTIPALNAWIVLMTGKAGSVTENTPNVGYVIHLPAGISTAQIRAFAQTLGYVRPAGVPFTIVSETGGLYLDTDVFLDGRRSWGNYLADGATPVDLGLSPVTNNATPLLPDLLLVDPTLNPGV